MKKILIIGCLLATFIMITLPSTSALESKSIEKRLEIEKEVLKSLEKNPAVKNKPYKPTCILLFLLWFSIVAFLLEKIIYGW